MARNSIFLSFVLLLLLSSISPSLEDDVIRFVRNHLKAFGYLSGDHHTSVDDSFDEALLVSALRKYQTFYGLNVSGRIEPDTLTMMSRPRCGVPDRPSRDNGHNITLQYAFFPGNPKWPKSKKKLRYEIITKTPLPIKSVKIALSSSFSKWSAVSRFTFKPKSFLTKASIFIGFYKGDHGDGYPFDGRGGMYAHASPPPYGDLHFDEDEEWGTNPDMNHLDLESVSLHEMGHLLGLEHSNIESAVMFPYFDYGRIKRDLQQDDIDGIHALYAHD